MPSNTKGLATSKGLPNQKKKCCIPPLIVPFFWRSMSSEYMNWPATTNDVYIYLIDLVLKVQNITLFSCMFFVHLTRAHDLYEFNRGHAVCSCGGNVSQRKGPFSSILS